MYMSIDEMREALINHPKYRDGRNWKQKVMKMPDNQVFAIYKRMEGAGDFDDYITFEDWYDSSRRECDEFEFADNLQSLVESHYDVAEFFEEPSVQGFQGSDFVQITLSNGSNYEFEFDWEDELCDIYQDGPKAAAKAYFQEIRQGIDGVDADTSTSDEDFEDPLEAAKQSFESGHYAEETDFKTAEDYARYLEYMYLGPEGFYEEFKEALDFDEMFVEAYDYDE